MSSLSSRPPTPPPFPPFPTTKGGGICGGSGGGSGSGGGVGGGEDIELVVGFVVVEGHIICTYVHIICTYNMYICLVFYIEDKVIYMYICTYNMYIYYIEDKTNRGGVVLSSI